MASSQSPTMKTRPMFNLMLARSFSVLDKSKGARRWYVPLTDDPPTRYTKICRATRTLRSSHHSAPASTGARFCCVAPDRRTPPVRSAIRCIRVHVRELPSHHVRRVAQRIRSWYSSATRDSLRRASQTRNISARCTAVAAVAAENHGRVCEIVVVAA